MSLLLICNSLSMPICAEEDRSDASISSGCHSVDAAMALSDDGRLTETAQAVIIYELNSDTMLYTYNPDKKIYPTSMVKLMTVLVALEQGELSEQVTVTRKALDSVAIGSVSANLKNTEVLTLEDLLYCTMIASANDAAAVVAEYIGGSQDGFVQLMNEKAEALGCKGTHYSNAHGLHDEGTYTTARDICRIMNAALENEQFRTIFEAVTYTVPATNKSDARVLTTSNNMAVSTSKYYDERVTGGKTGATDKGGRCLTVTAKQGGMDLLCIVMGAKATYDLDGSIIKYGSFEECAQLLNDAFSKYAYRQIFFDGQTLTQYAVQGGANQVVTQPAASASTVLPVKLDETLLHWQYTRESTVITAPVEKGQVLGSVQFWYGQKCLAQTDMVAMNAVAVESDPVVPEMPKKQRDEGSWKAMLVLLGVFGGVIVSGMLILLAARSIGNMRRKLRRRRRQRERRKANV